MLFGLPLVKRFAAGTLLALSLANAVFAVATEQHNEERESLVQVGQWQVELAVGVGHRNAIIVGESDFDF